MKKIIGLVAALGLLGGMFGYMQFNKTLDNTADLDADKKISAQELFSEFETDENTANKNYLDKIIEVTGTVASTKNEDGKTNIYLETEDMLANIFCQMENQLEIIPNDGDQVTIKGVCTGYLTDVVLVRSVIIE